MNFIRKKSNWINPKNITFVKFFISSVADLNDLKNFEKYLITLDPIKKNNKDEIKNNNKEEIKNRLLKRIDDYEFNKNKLEKVFLYFDNPSTIKVYNKIEKNQIENLCSKNILNLGKGKDEYLSSLKENNIKRLDYSIFAFTENFLSKLNKQKFLSIPFKTLNDILVYITLRKNLISSEQAYYIITENNGSRLISFIHDNSIKADKKNIIKKIIEKSLEYPNFNSSKINSEIFDKYY